jgi:hypothetical protein
VGIVHRRIRCHRVPSRARFAGRTSSGGRFRTAWSGPPFRGAGPTEGSSACNMWAWLAPRPCERRLSPGAASRTSSGGRRRTARFGSPFRGAGSTGSTHAAAGRTSVGGLRRTDRCGLPPTGAGPTGAATSAGGLLRTMRAGSHITWPRAQPPRATGTRTRKRLEPSRWHWLLGAMRDEAFTASFCQWLR